MLAVSLAACIPAALTVGGDASPTGGDTAIDGSDGSRQDSTSNPGDAGSDQIAADGAVDQATGDVSPGPDGGSDASDAAPLPDGYIVCPSTTQQCDIAGGQECCLTVDGTQGSGDAGPTYSFSSAMCEALGGPNCGAFIGAGNTFSELFPVTCSTAGDCPAGSSCCVAVGSDPTMIGSINCQAGCAGGKTICRDNGDCPMPKTCQPETDPILVHLFGKDCQ